jgi:hypothetical protein
MILVGLDHERSSAALATYSKVTNPLESSLDCK